MRLLRRAVHRAEREFHATLAFREWIPLEVREALYEAACRAARSRWGAPSGAPAPHLDALVGSGFAELPPVDASAVEELNRCLRGHEPTTRSSDAGTKVWFPQESLATKAPFLRIATDRAVVDVVEAYLQGPALIASMSVVDSSEATGLQNANFFHVDYHGHRAAKCFVYLSDVTNDDGPHEFVLRSHTPSGRARLVEELDGDKRFLATQLESHRRYQGNYLINNEVVLRYLGPRVRSVVGPAGTRFVVSTSGLHRGRPASAGGRRRLFKILYTVLAGSVPQGGRAPLTDAYLATREASSLGPRRFDRMCHRIVDVDGSAP